MRKRAFAAVAALTVILAGCFGSGPSHTERVHKARRAHIHTVQHRANAACPAAQPAKDIHGKPFLSHHAGDCAPPSLKRRRLAPLPKSLGGEQGPDLSNNDPFYNQQAIRNHGHLYEWLKLTESVSFVDRTAAGMAANGKRAGIIVGGYLFSHVCMVSPIAEGQLFVSRIRALGLTGHDAARWILDIEYGGCSTQAGSVAWIRAEYGYVRSQLGTPGGFYSGNWWLAPHTGCLFASLPADALAWISGYPYASPPCGHRLDVHQFGDHVFNGAGYGDMSRLVGVTLDQVRDGQGPLPTPPQVAYDCQIVQKYRSRSGAYGHWRRAIHRRNARGQGWGCVPKPHPIRAQHLPEVAPQLVFIRCFNLNLDLHGRSHPAGEVKRLRSYIAGQRYVCHGGVAAR